jgi:hypothetical protein
VSGPPDLRELVGDDVPGPELERLARIDAALRRTPAPPELPPGLTARVLAIPDRGHGRVRLLAAIALAAAIAGAAFGIGLWAAGGEPNQAVAERLVLHSTTAAPANAEMVIDILPADEAGNWRMAADVKGLRPLPAGGYYEVGLTQGGKVVATCGRFVVDATGAAHHVWLNAPYDFDKYDRWVVTAHVPGTPASPWVLDGPVT